MVDCISSMVLVSAAAAASFFLATAAFFRGFTDPLQPPRRNPPAPVTTNNNENFPNALGLRFGPNKDPLEEEASQSLGHLSPSEAFSNHNQYHHQQHHSADSLFPPRLDNLDMDRILNNRRLVRNYVGCMVGQKPCTAEGKEFRRAVPDALLTECAKCSPHMRRNMAKAVTVMQQRYPREWELLMNHFDPDGVHRDRYTQIVRAEMATSEVLVKSRGSTRGTA